MPLKPGILADAKVGTRKLNPRVPVLFLAIALAILSSCARKRSYLADTVDFDQVYIPALSYSADGKAAESRAAMMLLLTQWRDYRDRYRNYRPNDRQWSSVFEQADRSILEANRILNTDGSLYRVYDQLASVRVGFMLVRQRDSITYYPDYLVDFHGPMKTVVMSVKNWKPESLPEGASVAIKNLLTSARLRWARLETATFDPKLYQFDPRKQAQLAQNIKAQTGIIDQLQKALEQGDNAQIISTAQKLAPAFEQIYRLFGDFRRVRDD
jgi:hypothetical protein